MKKAMQESEKKERFGAYLTPKLRELLSQRAKDEGNNESEIITKALTMYLTKDITDESLLIAKMSEIIRLINKLFVRADVHHQIFNEWLQIFYTFSPEFKDIDTERDAQLKRGAQRAQAFITSFAQRKTLRPDYLEGIFGEMLEEDVPENKG